MSPPQAIPVLQHVPEEGPAGLTRWAQDAGLLLTPVPMWTNPDLPDVDAMTGLIILGGPMNTDEDDHYPWMRAEKRLIEAALARTIPVLGICLGAQLMADVLGARVGRHTQPEIGWFEVRKTPEAAVDSRFHDWPERWTPLHWHGDAFAIPAGAVRLAGSEVCENQAYLYGDRALGLQCHPEATPEWTAAAAASEGQTLARLHRQYPESVQSADAILSETRHYDALAALLPRLLNPIFQVQ